MQNILVTGWYGTETIGDRAILAGLIKLFSDSIKNNFSLYVSAIYPFVTERTIIEDLVFYKEISKNLLDKVEIFPINNIFKVRKIIKKCDIVVFGGGPLMDIPDLVAIEYIFKYAKQNRLKTALLGCGVGPINESYLIKSMMTIIDNSDICIFRDKKSTEEYRRLGGSSNVLDAIDPAVFAADYYRKSYTKEDSGDVVMNFRDIRGDKYDDTKCNKYEEYFRTIVEKEAVINNVHLIPMHTFVIGGDDRYYLTRISEKVNSKNITVQQIPLSLKNTMQLFRNAKYCYGMRFHSILLQTILNGHNIVLDYTDPNKGKIVGLLDSLGIYKTVVDNNRYYSLLDDSWSIPNSDMSCKVHISDDLITQYYSVYLDNFQKLA